MEKNKKDCDIYLENCVIDWSLILDYLNENKRVMVGENVSVIGDKPHVCNSWTFTGSNDFLVLKP